MKISKNKNLGKLVVSACLVPLILGLSAILFLSAGPIVYGFDAQTRMQTGISQKVENELENSCECEKVQQFFLMQGYQIRKQESFGRRADYKIFNPKNNTNLNQEMKRINTILNEKVTNYKTLDLVTFEFIVNKRHTIFSVQNGNINI